MMSEARRLIAPSAVQQPLDNGSSSWGIEQASVAGAVGLCQGSIIGGKVHTANYITDTSLESR